MWTEVPIIINDVTLREWDQAPMTSFIKEEKMLIAVLLEELWVDNIEAWFAASRVDFENIKWVFEIIDEDWPIVATLWRATENDTKASIEVTKGYKNARIHIFLATSDEHIKAKFWSKAPTIIEQRNWLRDQVRNEVERAKQYKDTHNQWLEIEFSPEDATWNALTQKEDWKKYLDFKSDQFNFLVEICEIAIKSWATIINTPDTLWNFLPHETEKFFLELSKRLSYLRDEWFQFDFSAHIHNDLWLASANAISAIRWGATQVEVTINGIWERAWNTTLHEIIWIIWEKWHAILDDWEVILSSKIRTELIWPTSEFVRRILNLNKELQKPFIWALSDVDWSGVHNAAQDVYWWSKNKRKYGWASIPEFFSPRWWANQIVSMLEKYWVEEDAKGQLIWTITQKACKRAETVKAMFEPNIYSMYLKTSETFSIDNINIEWNKVEVTFTYKWKKYSFSWEWEWENGFTQWLINWINDFIWEDLVDIESIDVVNKPSLKDAFNRYVEEAEWLWIILSEKLKWKVARILWESDIDASKSKQIWVSHIHLSISGNSVRSVWKDHDINYAIAKAIFDWALPEIINKIDSQN